MITDSQPSLSKLFASFFRLGLTAFGGPSMVAYIRRLSVQDKQWLTPGSFNDGVALCQVIPGATAMQSAAYVGLKARGVAGAAATFIGFGLPAFFLMSFLAGIYKLVINMPMTTFVFSCLQAIIIAIIANAAISFGKNTLKEWRSVFITAISVALFWMQVNPIIIIVVSACAGIVLDVKAETDKSTASIREKTKSTLRPVLLILSLYAVILLILFFLNRDMFTLSTLMFRIDLFAFGGGFASVPLMYHEIVEVRHMLDAQAFLNGIALGQVTPGPIVITATFVGYLIAGMWGGIIGTISIFLPSFMMVVGVTPFFDRLRNQKYFNAIITGILSSFVGLLFVVTVRFATDVHWGPAQIFLGAAALIALFLQTDILYVVLAGVAMSAAYFLMF